MHARLVFLLFLLVAVVSRAGDSVLVFNEIQYHPANESTQTEWIELRSLQGVDVDISGWRIEGGVDYTFPAGTTMPGGGYIVVAATPGQIPGALGPFTGQLDNGGETLRLVHRSGRIMDELTYSDGGDWPVGADGSGVTLARRDASAGEGPQYWTTSAAIGGTPGTQNFATAGAQISTVAQSLTGTWKYESNGADIPGWTTPAFDDSSWATGTAPFYFGNPQPQSEPAGPITSVGVWSMARWTGDADSQISSAKTYTHKVDLGHAAAQTVINGVTFDNHQTSGGSGVIRSGTNWTLTGAGTNYTTNTGAPRNTMPVGSGSKQLLDEFYYGTTNTTTEILELTGLTPNQFYIVTLYCTGWDTREFRRVRVTPDNTGIPTVLDEGPWGIGKGTLVKYHFAAPASGRLAITIEPLGDASWHQYAFTNEVAAPIPAETVLGGSVQAVSSQFTNRGASFSVDGSGLDANGGHSTTGNGFMWQTNGTAAAPNDPLPADITWLLNAPATLTGLRIWNFNELLNPTGTVTDNTGRGVKDVEIFVSPDAAGETFTSAGTYTVPQAFGCTAEIGSRIAFATAQRNVRRVRLVANTNWGDASGIAGLSEVRFLTAGTLLPANPVTTRYRKQFTISGQASSTYTLSLQYGVDDGAVFYLNGTEIHRANITGAVSNTTLADSNVTSPRLSTIQTLPGSAFVSGTNVLAVELHQGAGGTGDAWFAASLTVNETTQDQGAQTLRFNEISAASAGASFFIELRNPSGIALDTTGWTLRASTGQSVPLPQGTLAPGALLVLDAAQLGFTPLDGTRLFLVGPGGTTLGDAREVTNRLRGLTADGAWGRPSTATPGAANLSTVNDAIVINEIFYHGLGASPEQWVELRNRSNAAVDLSGWSLTDAVSFSFAAGTTIQPGGFIVVAWNPTAFASLHPGVAAVGPWSGNLSGKGEKLTLTDANDNVADQVSYSDGGRWSSWADGGGSSLELRDGRADNTKGEAWDASDESGGSTWQTVSYSGLGVAPNASDPVLYNEFVFGLLNAGEFLIDDISVKDMTLGGVELIQNGSFSNGTAGWRIIGTHTGVVVDDPVSPGNKVLKVTASSATEHMHNHAETTLKNGSSYHSIDPSHTYAISFRAKWLRGSNRLHTRLWHNRLARQTLLNTPATGGTPGAPNSRAVANIGPTFDQLGHTPTIPAVSQSVTVSIKVSDPDNVASVQLFTSVDGTPFTSTAMTLTGAGAYTGTVPGQASGSLVQLYVRATDSLNAVSFFPADGPSSRAMIAWEDSRAKLQLPSGARPHNIRILVPKADATELYKSENLMSDGAVPCTVVLDESKVYYRAGVRLKSSEHGRISDTRCGYTLEFPSDDLFLGTHDTIAIDRSGGTSAGQKEILLKTLSNIAGGIYAPEDDIVRVISLIGTSPGAFTGATMTGPAILSKTRLDKEFLDAQFPDGGSGAMFKYERVYVLTETINPATRAVTAVDSSSVLTAISENPKVPQSTTSPPGVAVTSLGNDKESYRWYWLIQNARDTDDYSGIMNVTKAVGQAGGSAAFNTQTAQTINVSSWLRATIPASLFGVIDNYLGAGGGQHNTLIYFPPGQKAVLMPWDLDFLSQTTPTTSLTSGGDVAKFIADPVNKRLFYGHVLDILNRSFNTTTMSKWATHYSRFGTDDMTTSLSYLTQRAAYARDVVNGTNGQTAPIPPVAFTRTSPSPTSVATPFATVSGDGWINIAEIRLQGSSKPLQVTWTDDNSWTLQLPIQSGSNTYTLVAYDNTGAQLGTTTVTITGTGNLFPAGPGSLVVSELNYNPPGNTDATEFIELLNITATALDLSGCHFDEENGQGISYIFPSGVQVPAGGRIVVPRNRTAFLAAYPNVGSQLAPNQYDPSALDNSGESLVLYAASGLEIFRFAYTDAISSTDGNGRTLVRVLSSTNPDPNSYTWRASTADGGSPGGTDAIAFSGNALADADRDGLVALLEYGFGTSDSTFTALPTRLQRDALGRWQLVLTRALNADDVALVIEVATSPGSNWGPANATLVGSALSAGTVTETWEISPPVPGSTSFFVRLRATLR